MFKHCIVLSLFLLYFLQFARAQSEIDSLRNVLSASKEDTSKVRTYLHFFYTDLFYSDPAEVIAFTHKALDLAENIDDKTGIVEAKLNLGEIYRIRSNNDSAKYYFEAAREDAIAFGNRSGERTALTGIGNTYNRTSEWKKAIESFDAVIASATEDKDTVQIASAHNNMGNTFLNQGELEKALPHFQKSAELGDKDIREVALINMGVVHMSLSNLDRAREYFSRGLEMAQQMEKKFHVAFIYKNLGVVEKKSLNFDKALEYYDDALEIYDDVGDRYSISEVYNNIGNVHFEHKDFNEAISYYRRSLEIQREIDHLMGACYSLEAIGMSQYELGQLTASEQTLLQADALADSLELLTAKWGIAQTLSNIYEDKGDFKAALEYSRAYKTLSDSVMNLEKSKQIEELETRFETSRKEQEIELLSAENQVAQLQMQKQENLRNYLIIIAVVLVILIAVGYSRYVLKEKANRKLKELDELKTNFFTNISHEFRTPLSLILSPADKALQKKQDPETTQQLTLIKRNADHLLELTNQIMDLSKLEAGKLELSVSEQDPESFLRMIASSFESLAVSKNIEFTTTFVRLPSEALFDTDKLQKILNNLLSNAFKFTPYGGKVMLECTSEKDYLILAVHDTGPGLTEPQQHMIFERFQQARESGIMTGTGVGLAHTRELVRLHHGKIQLTSAPGEGSSFTVTIPHTPAGYPTWEIEKKVSANEDDLEDSEVLASTGTDMPVLLIAEDNKDLREHIASLFSGNYSILQTPDGRKAFETAKETIPDIIISDLMMPEMDGMELCAQLRADERTSHIPVIMLTAKADRSSKLEGLETGADDYLSKPFDNDELLVRVRNLVVQRKRLQERFSSRIKLAPSGIEVTSPEEAFLEKAMGIVEENISNPEFSVEDFQKSIGMSRMQLHRKLKALTNFSASEFIRNIRLEHAARILSSNGHSVADAAYGSGFSSLSYFSQCFRKKFGTTPSKYTQKTS